uniref:C2H2-type domain-containing protein n=1 Tax=Timema poppense TaxID=170557 RepID=A0A7R9DT62_TIMPO|nr:unnamed protein product [Timema poppensis]
MVNTDLTKVGVCGKCFKLNSTLKTYLNTHDKHKPHKCDTSQKSVFVASGSNQIATLTLISLVIVNTDLTNVMSEASVSNRRAILKLIYLFIINNDQTNVIFISSGSKRRALLILINLFMVSIDPSMLYLYQRILNKQKS